MARSIATRRHADKLGCEGAAGISR